MRSRQPPPENTKVEETAHKGALFLRAGDSDASQWITSLLLLGIKVIYGLTDYLHVNINGIILMGLCTINGCLVSSVELHQVQVSPTLLGSTDPLGWA